MCGGVAVAVVHRDGECGGDRFTGGEEVQIPFADGVGPVDGAVVGVAGISADGETSCDRRLLSGRQVEGCDAISQQCGDGAGGFGCGGGIGEIEIGKADRAAVAQAAAFGDRTGHIRGGDGGHVIGAVDVDDEVL